MKKAIVLLLFVLSFLHAQELIPYNQFKVSAAVTDLKYKNNKLYVATAMGKINIFDTNSFTLLNNIKIPKVKDFMGDVLPSKIYSLDIRQDKVIFASQGEKGSRRLYLYDKKLINVINDRDNFYISKVRFVDENTVVFALLSSVVYLYDIKLKKILWQVQVSQSKFSDFEINENKSRLIVADESGDLKELDVKTGKIVHYYKGQNLDNVYQVAFENGVIATAGQDRKTVVYLHNKSESYFKSASFIVYSVGLSPLASKAAFTHDEDNNILIFDIQTKEDLHVLKAHKSIPTDIEFKNEKALFTSDSNDIVYYWKLEE